MKQKKKKNTTISRSSFVWYKNPCASFDDLNAFYKSIEKSLGFANKIKELITPMQKITLMSILNKTKRITKDYRNFCYASGLSDKEDNL
ncbi:hypothetical protein HGB13_03780 [bacterium]|nr:hypothetical protein [bacterium]